MVFSNSYITKFYRSNLGWERSAIRTCFCFEMAGITLYTNRIAKINYFIINNPSKNLLFSFTSSIFISNLNSTYFFLKHLADWQVYVPIEMQGSKTNIKRDFSIASRGNVTAECVLS